MVHSGKLVNQYTEYFVKSTFSICLFFSIFLNSVFANSNLDLIRLNLNTSLTSFNKLINTESLVFSLDLHKKLYRKSCHEIKQSSLEIEKQDQSLKNIKTAHAFASSAYLRIRDLKASGQIGYKSAEARKLFIFSMKNLQNAIVSLHQLKSNTNKRDLFQKLYLQ